MNITGRLRRPIFVVAILLLTETVLLCLYLGELYGQQGQPNGVSLDRAVFWGGAGRDYPRRMVHLGGHLYVRGSTSSFGAGREDVLLLKYTLDGGLVWSRTWGGMGSDTARSVSVVGDGVYVAGITYGVSGDGQAFLLKYTSPNDSGDPIVALMLNVAIIAVGALFWMVLVREILHYLK